MPPRFRLRAESRIRKELVEYCGLDTEAMVLLVSAIQELCKYPA
ncbi:MAG: hypothetical protein OEM52_08840 [bacterium]|nr:hypothetical protein [bacterium]